MLKHIVMWKLKEEALGASKAANGLRMKELLEALPSTIKEILQLEVGLNTADDASAADVVLLTTFKCPDCLKTYATHPDHLAVVAFVKQIVAERWVVDYEI